MSKVALITGITGQDGAYLAEYLVKKGYTVHGIKRRSSMFNTDRIDHLYQDPHIENRNLILHYGDLTDSLNLTRIIGEVQPDEIYNLAAMSHVKVSFDRCFAYSGSRPFVESDTENPYLSGVNIRTIWFGAGSSSEGNYTFLPEKSVCRSKTLWLLDNCQLS